MTAAPWMTIIEDMKRALAAKDRAATNAAVTALLDARAPIGPQWRQIAELMRMSGELTLAHRAIDAFVAAAGNTPQARYAKVVLLTQSGRLAEAYAMLDAMPEDVPDRGGRAYVLGNVAMTLGRRDEARAHLEVALAHRPGWGPAWLTLASVVDLSTDPLGERLLGDLSIAEKQGPADHARYHYALGKLHVDRRDADAAFAAFARGGQILRRETPYSRDANAANARAAMTGFDGDLIERCNAAVERDTSRPIFVTGLPRSGTTLVEQILASHSTVADGGELNLGVHLAVATGGVSGDDLSAYLTRGGSADALAGLYLHLLNERCDGAAGVEAAQGGAGARIVDKTIDLSRHLGLIASALPQAPLIWMRRDPMDSAWSCLRTFFIHGVGWSYSLTDIAHHFRLEDMLCQFWQQRLGPRLLVLPYADLIDQPEQMIRRLLAHCNLAEEPGVFQPHKTERVVATASALQVRRPINRDGLNVAAPYAAHMQPFVEAYGAVPLAGIS